MKTLVKKRRTEPQGVRRERIVGVQALLAAAIGLSPGALGALLIDVGSLSVLPDTPGQVLDIYLLNTGPESVSVAGISLNIQINDSGPADRGGMGTRPGPSITGVDILGGTLFAGNNTGQVNGAGALQFANARTTTSSGTISIDVGGPILLGSVEIDTTGFYTPETWELRLWDTVNGPSRFFAANGDPLVPTITDGLLTAIPESAWAVTAFGLGALVFAVTRRLKS